MNFFKSLVLLSVIFTTLSTCKDEECVAPEISVNIVGVWNTTLSTGEVEFKSDGTLIDSDDVIIGIGSASASKTYTISGTTLTVSASASGSSISSDFEVTQNECDQIKISILGIAETLNRK